MDLDLSNLDYAIFHPAGDTMCFRVTFKVWEGPSRATVESFHMILVQWIYDHIGPRRNPDGTYRWTAHGGTFAFTQPEDQVLFKMRWWRNTEWFKATAS
ncbi:MAG: hypothetical protein EOP83_19050 [Verrucomicrobiaceae bacterium]|nr:MAG: hypothetical protein EOP83_19050 [Verrucomicrobiaceae bacterium]